MSEAVGGGEEYGVPPPVPPDDGDAWYAPSVRAQYEVHPGVVATIRESGTGFSYDVREPSLGEAGRDALARVREHFAETNLARPRTREGAVERMTRGFDAKYRRVVDRLTDLSPAARRRLDYHALADLRCLDELTPYALDCPRDSHVVRFIEWQLDPEEDGGKDNHPRTVTVCVECHAQAEKYVPGLPPWIEQPGSMSG